MIASSIVEHRSIQGTKFYQLIVDIVREIIRNAMERVKNASSETRDRANRWRSSNLGKCIVL